MKTGIRIALLIGLLAGGYWLWRVVFPGDDALIRRQLQELARAASFSANEAPFVKLTKAAEVANSFAPDTAIDLDLWDYGRVKLEGRDEVRQAALAARSAVPSLTVEVADIEVSPGPNKNTASVRFTIFVNAGAGSERQSQELKVEFRKHDGDWLIQRAQVFNYLNQ